MADSIGLANIANVLQEKLSVQPAALLLECVKKNVTLAEFWKNRSASNTATAKL